MIVFPNCKINLGLNILGKRPDGFHDLETVFYPVPLKDCLEVIQITATSSTSAVIFSTSGLAINGAETDNLCIKAYQLLKNDFPQLPAIKLHLHKVIPMGAGLGGGSADAALMLELLNDQFSLGISEEKLSQYALQLGSDCPFFLLNQPCIATGRGESLNKIAVNLHDYQLLLVNPGIHINTAWAFTELRLQTSKRDKKPLIEIITQPVSTWKSLLTNDFEAPVFLKHPVIKEIKENLYQKGAVYAAMSGSGSSIFGLFDKHQLINHDFVSDYFARTIFL